MKKRTKRLTGAILTTALVIETLFSDMVLPNRVFSTEASAAEYLFNTTGITSDYIKNHLNASVAEEVSGIDAYLEGEGETQPVTEAETEAITEETETEIVINISDKLETEEATEAETAEPSSLYIVETEAETAEEMSHDETFAEEEIALYAEEVVYYANVSASELEINKNEITYDDTMLVSGYDANGLGVTYHYIKVNFSLINKAACYSGVTIEDIWNNNPDDFIAAFTSYVNVYAIDGVDDYFVAFINAGAVNTMGNAIAADFTDGNNAAPTVYNDIISFDAQSGMAYIPKSFFYDAEGAEIIRSLNAQVLVPYTFTGADTSLYQLTIENNQSGVRVPEVKSVQQANAFDVTMSFAITTADTAKYLNTDGVYVYLNDDEYPATFDDGQIGFDRETGILTIAQSSADIYAVKVVIAEPEAYACGAQDILIAALDGVNLGNILKEASYTDDGSIIRYKMTDGTGADMKATPGLSIKGNFEVGDLYRYNAPIQYGSGANNANILAVSKSLYQYCYYVNVSARLDSIFPAIYEANSAQMPHLTWLVAAMQTDYNNLSKGYFVRTATETTDPTTTNYYYDMLFGLPDKNGDDANYSASLTSVARMGADGKSYANTTGSIAVKFDNSLYNENVSLVLSNETYTNAFLIAHCAEQTVNYPSKLSESKTVNMRVLYKADTYAVLGFALPSAGGQAGFAMYKVTNYSEENYYTNLTFTKTANPSGDHPVAIYAVSDTESYVTALAKAAGVAPTYASESAINTALAAVKNATNAGEYLKTVKTTGSNIPTGTSFDYEGVQVVPETAYIYVKELYVGSDYKIDTALYRYTVKTVDDKTLRCQIVKVEKKTSAAAAYTDVTAQVLNQSGNYGDQPEEDVKLTGLVGVKKIDDAGNTVSGLKFNVYTGAQWDAAVLKGSITTTDGYAYFDTTATTYGGTWLSSKGKTRTYYIQEDKASALSKKLDWDGSVYKVVVTGAEAAADATVTVTKIRTSNGTTAADTAVTTSKNTTGNYFYFVQTNARTKLYGSFGVKKVDDAGNTVSGLKFNIYTGAQWNTAVLKGSITTEADGYASTSATAVAYGGTWYASEGDTRTYYIQEDEASARAHHVDWDGSVYKVVVTGAEAAADATVTVTKIRTSNGTTAADTAVTTSKNTAGNYFYFVQTNARTKLYGSFGVKKIDDVGNTVSGLAFDIYGDETLTNKLDTIITEADGYASASATATSLGGTWYEADGVTRTYYVRENAESAAALSLEPDATVYKVVVTGTENPSDSCTVAVTSGAADVTVSQNGTIKYFTVRDRQLTTHSFVKAFADETTADYITSITVQLTRNGEAFGDAIRLTNKTEGFAYTWSELYVNDENGLPYIYSVVEVKVNDISKPELYYDITTETVGTNTKITNARKVTNYTVTKQMDDNTKSVVSAVTVELYATVSGTKTVVYSTVLNAANNFSKVYTKLPVYDANGNQITYSAKETKVETTVDEVVTEYEATEIADYFTSLTTDNAYVIDADGNVVTEGYTIISNEIAHENISTTAKDGKTNSHQGVVGEEITIVDTVTYKNLIVGKTYTITGVLMVKETNEALLDADGNTITAQTTVTPLNKDSVSGETTVTFTFDSSLLSGKSLVVFEDCYRDGIKVASHADITDEEQTVVYPSIGTTAVDTNSETHEATYGETVSVTDTVAYTNLLPETAYTIKGEVVLKSNGETFALADGTPVTVTKTFTTPASDAMTVSGTVDVEFVIDTTLLAGESIVVFEALYYEDYLIALHADIEDEYQTIVIGKVKTSATDKIKGSHEATVGVNVVIEDKVEYELLPETEYTISGILMDKETEEPILVNGNTITATTTFTTAAAADGKTKVQGTVILTYTLSTKLLQGKTIVVFEDCYRDGIKVASHADITDEAQTIVVPHLGQVIVNKTDEDGVNVEGVTFTVTRKDTNEVVATLVTDENGYAISEMIAADYVDDDLKLVPITYILKETYVPEGIVLDVTEEEFTLSGDIYVKEFGRVDTIQRGCIEVIKRGLAVTGTDIIETKYGIEIHKMQFDYVLLPGVEFTVYADEACTEVVTTVTTNASGHAKSEPIKVGKYYIKETNTPKNYAKDDTVYSFEIKGIAQDGEAVEYVLDVTKDIENKLLSSELTIRKTGVDAKGNVSPLAGVIFGVFAAEDITNAVTTKTVVKADTCIALIKTNADGIATLTECLPQGRYYYRELETSTKDYVLDEEKYEFEVKLTDNAADKIQIEKEAVNYTKTGTLVIHKVDQDNKDMGAGIKFLLTNDAGMEWTLITDATSYASISNLPIGHYNENGEFVYYTYKLFETETWDKYSKDNTTYEWCFTESETDAKAVYKSYTVTNTILGIKDYSSVGGIFLILLGLMCIMYVFKPRKLVIK